MDVATATARIAQPEITTWMPRNRRWSREEYHRLADLGIIGPEERVELINGEIIEKSSPQSPPHSTALGVTHDALEDAFGRGFHVRCQSPMTLDNDAEPEPDILVARGKRRDYNPGHPRPADTMLIVEIADSSLEYDRETKGAVYSSAGIADYWIVNINKRCLEIYREPDPATGYKSITFRGEAETVTPLAAPASTVKVSDLLP